MDFNKLKNITIPLTCVAKAYDHIRMAGLKRLEGVVLLAGVYQADTDFFEVRETIVPKQLSVLLEEGLLYAVDGEELHRINVYLHANGMVLIAQLHSHPGRAYHSSTDDAFPIITKLGGLSIVIPNFGADNFSLDRWAVYRLNNELRWEELSRKTVRDFIRII
jgi:proteasome lid subunit RPN8/RPN11